VYLFRQGLKYPHFLHPSGRASNIARHGTTAFLVFSERQSLYECRLSITIVVLIHCSCLANWFTGLVVRVYICRSVWECASHCVGTWLWQRHKMAIHFHSDRVPCSTKGFPFILLSGKKKKQGNNWASHWYSLLFSPPCPRKAASFKIYQNLACVHNESGWLWL